MRKLKIGIEINGTQVLIGVISGDTDKDAVFAYSDEYLNSPYAKPISISLPLSEGAFNPIKTRNFFDGLLPEGFLRRIISENNRIDNDDYISMIETLGKECLGAISVISEDYEGAASAYRELDSAQLYKLAAEGIMKSADMVVESRISLTGASGKVGVYRSNSGKWFMPLGNAPSTHILKQSHVRYDSIVQNEELCLLTAKKLGIDIPKSIIVDTKDTDSGREVLLATERYDRTFEGSDRNVSGLMCPLRLHQEDFAQAMGIASSDKYEGRDGYHMRGMFDILRSYSASPIEDQMKLWDMIVFHYLIGNTDGHIKNFSLLYNKDLNSIRLAPAYDIVSTIVYDSHSTKMAFSIGGEVDWNKIDRDSFKRAAEESGLNIEMFMRRYDEMAHKFDNALSAATDEMVHQGYSEAIEISKSIRAKRDGKVF